MGCYSTGSIGRIKRPPTVCAPRVPRSITTLRRVSEPIATVVVATSTLSVHAQLPQHLLRVPPPFLTMAKKKKSSNNLGARLALVMKSGKYSLGYKSTIKTLRSDKCKLVLIGMFDR